MGWCEARLRLNRSLFKETRTSWNPLWQLLAGQVAPGRYPTKRFFSMAIDFMNDRMEPDRG